MKDDASPPPVKPPPSAAPGGKSKTQFTPVGPNNRCPARGGDPRCSVGVDGMIHCGCDQDNRDDFKCSQPIPPTGWTARQDQEKGDHLTVPPFVSESDCRPEGRTIRPHDPPIDDTAVRCPHPSAYDEPIEILPDDSESDIANNPDHTTPAAGNVTRCTTLGWAEVGAELAVGTPVDTSVTVDLGRGDNPPRCSSDDVTHIGVRLTAEIEPAEFTQEERGRLDRGKTVAVKAVVAKEKTPGSKSTTGASKKKPSRPAAAKKAARAIPSSSPLHDKVVDIAMAEDAAGKVQEELTKLDRNDGPAVACLIAAGINLANLKAATKTDKNWTERVKEISLDPHRRRFLNPRTARRMMQLGESWWAGGTEPLGSEILAVLPSDLQRLTWLCKLSPGQLTDFLVDVDCKGESRKHVIDAVQAVLEDFVPKSPKPASTDKVVALFAKVVAKTATSLEGAIGSTASRGEIRDRLREVVDRVLAGSQAVG